MKRVSSSRSRGSSGGGFKGSRGSFSSKSSSSRSGFRGSSFGSSRYRRGNGFGGLLSFLPWWGQLIAIAIIILIMLSLG